jgi:hypothetical protein
MPHLPAGTPDIQMVQTVQGLGALPDRLATVRFWGLASVPRQVTVTLRGARDGRDLARAVLTLAPWWQGYEFTVQPAGGEDAAVLTLGLQAGVARDVWFDGIEVVPGQPSRPLLRS